MITNRHQINKFITYVEAYDAEVRRFAADPSGYVTEWQRRGAASRVPVPDGGDLTPQAAAALAGVDYATLYRMGAHPYVLWHFCEGVLVWAGQASWSQLKEEYRDAVAAAGLVDFST